MCFDDLDIQLCILTTLISDCFGDLDIRLCVLIVTSDCFDDFDI